MLKLTVKSRKSTIAKLGTKSSGKKTEISSKQLKSVEKAGKKLK